MSATQESKSRNADAWLVRATALLQLVVPAIALIGWATSSRSLTALRSGGATMKVTTATAFIALGLALLLEESRQRRQGTNPWLNATRNALLIVPLAIALLSGLEYLGVIPTLIDEALFSDQWSSSLPGRPSQVTTAGLLLGALLLWSSARPAPRKLFHGTAACLGTLGWFSTLAFVLSGESLNSVGWFRTFSVPTATCFFALTVGALYLHPSEGLIGLLRSQTAGGLSARSLLPLGAVGSVALGKLHVELVEREWVDPGAAIALFATLALFGVTALTLQGARNLNAAERKRAAAYDEKEATLVETRAALERANAYLQAAPGVLLGVDEQGIIRIVNPHIESVLGYEQAELLGESIKRLIPERFRERHGSLFAKYWQKPELRPMGRGTDLVVLHKDQSERDVEITLSPVVEDKERLVICGVHDISKSKRAERRIRYANARLRLATSAARIGIWEWDIRTSELVWSDEMHTLYGITPEQFGGSVETWWGSLLAEEIPGLERRIKAILEGSAPTPFDITIRRRDGTLRRAEVHCMVERSTSGEPLRMIGTNRDVTEEREAQERAVAERLRFEGIFNSMFQLTWLVDLEGRVEETNKTALEFAATTPDKVTGVHLADTPWWIQSTMAANQLRRSLEKATAGRFVRYVTRVRDAEGREVPVDISIKPLASGDNETHTLIVEGRDVSEAEAARSALIQSEARFRSALDYSAIGFALVDLSGRWIRVNKALCRILKRSEEELLQLTFQDVTHADDIEEDWKFVQELLAGQRSHYHMQKRYVLPDSSVVWCLLSVSLVRSPAGNPQYFVSQIQDFSERKAFEAHIQESLREKEVMLKEIHHRVNNNLQIVSSILRLGRSSIDDPKLTALFAETESRVRSMALVHELLYRSEHLASVDFGAQLRDLCDLIRRTWSAPDKVIKVHVDAVSVPMDMDTAIPLGLVAHELVSNALKHAFADREHGNVWVTLTHSDDALQLQVRDDGIGLAHGFELNRARSLGMRIVARLTQQLRGRVRFVSHEGTSFTLDISTSATSEFSARQKGAA